MLTTKNILTEEIRRIISGGFPSDRDRVRDEEIKSAISDAANALLKVQVLDTNFNFDGGSSIEGSAIATYENIPISFGVNFGNVKTAVANLPATPMIMPEGMGVFQVYPSSRPDLAYRYIPSGMFGVWMDNSTVSPLHRRFYTWNSGKIIIYDDLAGAGYNEIDVQLVVSPIDTLDDNTPLPIPPDMKKDIIAMVIARYVQENDTNRRETDQPSPSKRN